MFGAKDLSAGCITAGGGGFACGVNKILLRVEIVLRCQ